MRKSELIKENKKLKKELEFYKPAYDNLIEKYEYVMNLSLGCEFGDYCDACIFKKTICVSTNTVFGTKVISYCDYGNTCKHFVSKEAMNNEV